jgi:hypothetical protein
MNPKIHLLTSMLLTQVHNVFISVFSNVKIQQIISHVQFSTQHDDTFIKFVHFEQYEQMIIVGLFSSVL